METEKLRSVLWDIEEGKIDSLPEAFILKRILCYGSLRLVFGAIARYGKESLVSQFMELPPTSMDPRRHHYLATYVFGK